MSDTRHVAATEPEVTGSGMAGATTTGTTGTAGRPAVVTEVPAGSAWTSVVLFGGIMLVMGGAFHAVLGLVALFDPGYYLVTSSGLVMSVDYTWWGVVHLVLGGLAVLAGIGVVGGRGWARVLGIVLAALSALANVAFAAAYPLWTITLVAVDLLVIYALAAHGREPRSDS